MDTVGNYTNKRFKVGRPEKADIIWNMSKHKWADIQMQQGITLNTGILDMISDLIVVCDQEGRVIRFNKACERISGYTFDQIKGKYFWDYVLPDEDIEPAKALFNRPEAFASLGIQNKYENCWVTRAGKRRIISWATSILVDENGSTYIVSIGNDITRQRKVEERLHRSEAELRTILKNANGIIYTLSPEGKFLLVSQGWTESLGHDITEVEGQSFEIFLHPDYVPVCRSFLENVISTGESQIGVEYLVKHRDGTWRWHTSSGAPVKDESGCTLYYVGLAIDITERKKAEAALRISEDKFSKAFHCNPDPITITTLADGRYVEVNDAWVETTGYERYEGIGRTGIDLGIWVAPEEREEMVKQVQEHGYIRDLETKFLMKSGEIGIFLISAEIINIEDKQHLLCVHKDITVGKRIEESLRLSEKRFSKAFNASPTTMSITSLEEGRYIDVNESFCRVVGYSRDEIVGRTALEAGFWLEPGDRANVKQKIMRKEPVRNLEINFGRKYRVQRLGLYSAERIDIDGMACLLSIVTDITEHKQDEEKIRYLSFHDKLTGLYNRAYFEEELKHLDTEHQLPISLIMGDVNGLKLVNDALGHLEGDKLLITVAEILRKSCRPEDIIARWGGDEFIVLLPGCTNHIASKIFDRIKSTCKLNSNFPIETSISIGLATKNNIAQDIEKIIKEAEDKMYRNKLLEDRSNRSAFLISLEKTLWERDNETEEHCQRMQEMALKIGQAIDLPESELDNLKLLAALHDIGKIAIPNSILAKPGKLTHEEWQAVKKHPETGYRIALSSFEMAPIAEAILHHHERWDGTGYPLGLKGENIPLISRIIAIADTCDAMIHGRPYQKAVSKEGVRAEVERCSGSQFDPGLVRIALEVLAESPCNK